MTFKEFLKKWGTGSPFSRREGKFNIIGDYKFNSNIFYVGIVFILLLAGYVFWSVGFSVDDNIYVKCDSLEQCINPFYKGVYGGSLSDKYTDKCVYNWCGDKYLSPGFEFGNKPGWLIQNFGVVSVFIIGICFIINHLLYNNDYKVKEDL